MDNMNEQNNNYGFFQKILHDVEKAKCHLNYEVGTLISPDGNVIKEYGGEEHRIKIPASDKPLFLGNIFTHNHPGGRGFTQEDIMAFADSGAIEARISTPQGTYYSIKESGGEINRSIGRVMQAEDAGSYTQATDIVRQFNLDLSHLSGTQYDNRLYEIMAEETDKWLAENAAEFGYVYTKGEI
jgi:hypothetical protein